MQPKGIVFWDWNGTLMDDVDVCVDCLNRLLADHGFPQRYSRVEYQEIFGFPIEDYYRRAGFDFTKFPFSALAEDYMKIYNAVVPSCPANAQAEKALSALQKRGWRQAVLSASRRDYLIEQVSARHLEGYFTELLGLQDIYGASKVKVGQDWLAASGIDPAACVMVGDSTHDAEVAAAMGTQCVLYSGGHQSRHRLEAACPHVIDSLSELPEVLETL